MPYVIKKVKGGYKVGKRGTGKSYSKKPMSKRRAMSQLRILYAAAKKAGEP